MTAPKYASRGNGGIRTYTFDDLPGTAFPSVTSIIGMLDKPALRPWGQKLVAEYAVDHRESWQDLPRADAVDLLKGVPYRTSTRKADLGSIAHDALDTGVTVDPDAPEAPYVAAGRRFLADHVAEVIYSEATVRRQDHVFAGTADLFVTLKNGQTAVADYKTSKAVGYIEQGLQLTALAMANEVVSDTGEVSQAPDPQVGVVVRLGADGEYEAQVIDLTYPDGSWTVEAVGLGQAFLGLRSALTAKLAWGRDGLWGRSL